MLQSYEDEDFSFPSMNGNRLVWGRRYAMPIHTCMWKVITINYLLLTTHYTLHQTAAAYRHCFLLVLPRVAKQ